MTSSIVEIFFLLLSDVRGEWTDYLEVIERQQKLEGMQDTISECTAHQT